MVVDFVWNWVIYSLHAILRPVPPAVFPEDVHSLAQWPVVKWKMHELETMQALTRFSTLEAFIGTVGIHQNTGTKLHTGTVGMVAWQGQPNKNHPPRSQYLFWCQGYGF